MTDQVRTQLVELVHTYGPALSKDHRRAEALLRDTCGDNRRAISVLVGGLKEGVATALLNGGDTSPPKVVVNRLTQRLQDNLGLAEDAARWSVESWAIAFGVLSEASAAGGAGPAETVRAPAGQAVLEDSLGPSLVVSRLGSAEYRSISDALAAARGGQRIVVRPGLYREILVIDKAVEIVGEGSTADIVVESAEGPCVLMRSDYAVVRGLTLRGVAARAGNEHFALDIGEGHLLLEDCDITSDSRSCVAIHGQGADPVIRRCKIHDGQRAGVAVFDQGRGTIEDCDIYANAGQGIHVAGGGPIVRRSRIHHSQRAGIFVEEQGLGTFLDCDIHSNEAAGVYVGGRGSSPMAKRCRIHDGHGSGIYVDDQGRGIFEDCSILANKYAGVYVGGDGSSPLVKRCKIHNGQGAGVSVNDRGRGIFGDCDIVGNALAGVSIRDRSNPVIHRCQVNANGGAAVCVRSNGAGNVEGCNLTGNKAGSWDTEAGCSLRQRNNRTDT